MIECVFRHILYLWIKLGKILVAHLHIHRCRKIFLSRGGGEGYNFPRLSYVLGGEVVLLINSVTLQQMNEKLIKTGN